MLTSQAENRTSADPVRHIAVQLATTFQSAANSNPPIKGGMKGDGSDSDRSEEKTTDNADMPGSHSVFVLVRDGKRGDETPVFPIENSTADAILIFTHRESAVLYLQIAEWANYRIRELSPIEIGQWAPTLEGDHVAFLIVNANRHHQIRGDAAQHAIDVRAFQDLSGENLYQEIIAMT